MTRVAFKMKLKSSKIDEYKKRHNEIWPELKNAISNAGISNYSIFYDEETGILFAYHEMSGSPCSWPSGCCFRSIYFRLGS